MLIILPPPHLIIEDITANPPGTQSNLWKVDATLLATPSEKQLRQPVSCKRGEFFVEVVGQLTQGMVGFSLSQKRKETMVWPAATSQHHSKQRTVWKEIETSDLSTSELWVLGEHALTVCLSIMIPNRSLKVLANAVQNVHVYPSISCVPQNQ